MEFDTYDERRITDSFADRLYVDEERENVDEEEGKQV